MKRYTLTIETEEPRLLPPDTITAVVGDFKAFKDLWLTDGGAVEFGHDKLGRWTWTEEEIQPTEEGK